MKYYIYISATKVDMLYRQIPRRIMKRIAADLRINVGVVSAGVKQSEQQETLISQTSVLTRYVRSHENVGSVASSQPYIEGNASLRWGTLVDYASDLVIFGGVVGDAVLALIGSSGSLVGQSPRLEAEQKGWHSINYYTMRFLNGVVGASPKAEASLKSVDGERYNGAMRLAVEAINQLPPRPNRLEFLAKRLFVEEDDKRLLVVATPIYVAMAE
jgi:hypothetical protein